MELIFTDKFKGQSFLKLLDFEPDDIDIFLDTAAEFKALKKSRTPHDIMRGRNVALVFEKTSTRTRCAFEVAAGDLGIHTAYIGPGQSQLGLKESVADTARILGGMFDGIEYRGYSQETVETLARYAGVPVWNGLTDEFHPTQVLADLLTIREYYGRLKGIKLVYMGDARYNMANSLMVGCALAGMDFTVCAPRKYFPGEVLTSRARDIARETGGGISFEESVSAAVKDADVIYTDIWVSMGEPDEVWAERIGDLRAYSVTGEVMEEAGRNCRFMHCLPSYHDLKTEIGREVHDKFGLSFIEVSDEVFEGPRSIVFDEAANRMHTIKALMALTLI